MLSSGDLENILIYFRINEEVRGGMRAKRAAKASGCKYSVNSAEKVLHFFVFCVYTGERF